MSELGSFLKAVEDDYLIGLSNKGIVKRSYKDLEKEQVSVEVAGEQIIGQVGNEKVILQLPLSNSICTCPAVGMCKHIVMTILTAKLDGGRTEETVAESNDTGGKEGEEKKQDKADTGLTNAVKMKNNATVDPMEETGRKIDSERTGAAETTETDTVKKIADSISVEQLKKAVDEKEWKRIIQELKSRDALRITQGMIVTVQDAATGMTVHLTTPLENSACTCHSKKLCRHKVKAILALKLESGVISGEELKETQKENTADKWDKKQILPVLKQVQNTLGEMLMTGSVRIPMEAADTLERYAISCHREGLANLELKLRALSERVKAYQGRHADATAEVLSEGVTEIYLLLLQLGTLLESGEDISALAGEFRSEYTKTGELLLMGLGMRHFVSSTGYEGETLYFLETNTGEWYTYTVARPTFYDRKPRQRTYGNAAPWGVSTTLAQLASSRIRLRDGKANAEHRLSSTSQASAELYGESTADRERILEYVKEDFARLWEEYSKRLQNPEDEQEYNKLFLIRPAAISDMHYDEIGQRLIFYLEDQKGRRLRSQLTYAKQEAAAIKSLERLRDRLERNKAQIPVFLGSIYVEDGECVLYPIETIEI
ncbi:MAG: hypothetical protein E7294_10220 [Lachnospiraceae bacterium]|nr:hypothetical protein [Lachnospiraceae bacterium]